MSYTLQDRLKESSAQVNPSTTDWHVKPPPSVRSVDDALRSAERNRRELPIIVQVYASDWDKVILADKLDEQARRIAELEAKNAGLRFTLSRQGKSVMPEVVALRQQVARLEATNAKMRKCLESIAEHHESNRNDAYKFGYPQGEEYHAQQRDFALDGLK